MRPSPRQISGPPGAGGSAPVASDPIQVIRLEVLPGIPATTGSSGFVLTNRPANFNAAPGTLNRLDQLEGFSTFGLAGGWGMNSVAGPIAGDTITLDPVNGAWCGTAAFVLIGPNEWGVTISADGPGPTGDTLIRVTWKGIDVFVFVVDLTP